MSNKTMTGNPDVIVGSGSGAPTDAAFYLQSMGPSDPSMPNRRYLAFGAGLSKASGGAGGIDTITTVNNGTVTSIAAGTNITCTPDPIVSTGTVSTKNALSLGTQTATLPLPDGVIDMNWLSGGGNKNVYSGLSATTGNSIVATGSLNTFTGVQKGTTVNGNGNLIGGNNTGVTVDGDGNVVGGTNVAVAIVGSNNVTAGTNGNVMIVGGVGGGDENSVTTTLYSIISGISHLVSAVTTVIITGYDNTLTTVTNAIIGGQENTVTSSNVVGCDGYQNSILNTTSASISGQNNSIDGGSNNRIDGRLNAITTGVQCAIRGYDNVITGGNDTWIEGYACQFDGGVTNDINILKGYNVRLINALNHRFNMWLCAAGGVSAGAHGRAATTYVGSLLIATGIPTAASAFDNSGVVAPPVGYEANNTVAIYGDRIVMDCNNAGEMRCVGVNNLRSANAPTTGDDYCNKTYVDSFFTTFSTVVTFSGIWATSNDAFIHGQRVGNIVTLFFETIDQAITTGALITAAAGAIPVGFRPSIVTHLHMNTIDNSIEVSGSIIVSFDGSLTIGTNYANPVNGLVQAQSAFQVLGTGGFPYTTVTYLITA